MRINKPSSNEPRSDQPSSNEHGTASIEFVALFPIVLIGMGLLLQLCAAVYTAHAASVAAREGAREFSLTGSALDGEDAARASLPGAVTLVSATSYGPQHGFRVVVQAPPVLRIGDRNFSSEVEMP